MATSLPKNEIEIRRAVEQDAPAVANVLKVSFLEFKSLYTEGGFAATALDASQVLARMSEGPVWVALRQNEIVGTVAAVIEAESVYVRGMAVGPSARGSGTGARLLQEVENWARAGGHARLFLSTTPFLDSAIRLYERFGFRRSGSPGDLFGTPLFTMEKKLG